METKFLTLLLAMAAPLPIAAETSGQQNELVKSAVEVLRNARTFDEDFNTGIGAQPSKNSIALLVILSNPAAKNTFTNLTDIPGIPSLYGLIGVRLVDQEGSNFKEAMAKVLERDREKEIRSRFIDDVGTSKVEQIVLLPESAKDRRCLKHGQYARELFEKSKVSDLSFVIENGLLCETLTNPYILASFAKEEPVNMSPEDRNNYKKMKSIIKENLLFKNPKGILKLVGFKSDQEILDYLKK